MSYNLLRSASDQRNTMQYDTNMVHNSFAYRALFTIGMCLFLQHLTLSRDTTIMQCLDHIFRRQRSKLNYLISTLTLLDYKIAHVKQPSRVTIHLANGSRQSALVALVDKPVMG